MLLFMPNDKAVPRSSRATAGAKLTFSTQVKSVSLTLLLRCMLEITVLFCRYQEATGLAQIRRSAEGRVQTGSVAGLCF